MSVPLLHMRTRVQRNFQSGQYLIRERFVPTTKVVFISSILLYLYIFLIKLQILAFNFETLF